MTHADRERQGINISLKNLMQKTVHATSHNHVYTTTVTKLDQKSTLVTATALYIWTETEKMQTLNQSFIYINQERKKHNPDVNKPIGTKSLISSKFRHIPPLSSALVQQTFLFPLQAKYILTFSVAFSSVRSARTVPSWLICWRLSAITVLLAFPTGLPSTPTLAGNARLPNIFPPFWRSAALPVWKNQILVTIYILTQESGHHTDY